MLQINVNRMYELMAKKTMTQETLAEKSKLSRRTLYVIRQHPEHFTARQIDCIAEALETSSLDLLEETEKSRLAEEEAKATEKKS